MSVLVHGPCDGVFDDAKVSVVFYEPPKPEGYWVGAITLPNGTRIGGFRGECWKEVNDAAAAWLKKAKERERRFQAVREWRAKHWWRRWQNPPKDL